MSTARIFATLATEEHAAAIAAFYRKVWNPHATPESVVAGLRRSAVNNFAVPGRPIPIAIVFVGGDVVAYCGSIPQRLWDGKQERPAYWVKGLMVLPEYRNGPLGHLVVKELAIHLGCSSILTVAPAARRLFSALGYTDLGAVSNWVRPLRPKVMAERLDLNALGLRACPPWVARSANLARRSGIAGIAAGVAGLAIDGLARASRRSSRDFEVSTSEVPSHTEIDNLWIAARAQLAASPVRDAAYITARFVADVEQDTADKEGKGRSHPYTFVAARQHGSLLGIAIVRKPSETPDPRLAGINVATISEFLFPLDRTDAGLALLGEVERATRAAGAHAVTCMTSHPRLANLLVRQGYLRLGGNVHFFLRDGVAIGSFPADLGAWWLSRGDGESDTSF